MDTIATVSFQDLPVPSPISPVAVNDSRTRIAVAPRDGSGEVMIFDGTGAYLGVLGRAGQGPGEYREIAALAFRPGSDSLWVIDEGNNRISVNAPDETQPSRMIPLRGRPFGAAWASDTALVVQGQLRDDAHRTVFAAAVYPGATTWLSLGRRIERAEGFDPGIRPITSAAGGGLWVNHFREPYVRRLDAGLGEAASYAYPAGILETTPANAEVWSDYIDTQPAVLAITEDPRGDLWVLIGIPADPLPAVSDPGRALAEGTVTVADLAHTVLLRYESHAITRGPADEFPQGTLRGGLLPGGLAYYFEADDLGEVTLLIVQLGSRDASPARAQAQVGR